MVYRLVAGLFACLLAHRDSHIEQGAEELGSQGCTQSKKVQQGIKEYSGCARIIEKMSNSSSSSTSSSSTAELEAQLETCFDTNSVDTITFDSLQKQDPEYAACLNESGVVQYQIASFAPTISPFYYEDWESYENYTNLNGVSSTSPCGDDPATPNSACCAALNKATSCQLSSNSSFDAECKTLLDDIVFDVYDCSSPVIPYITLICVVGSFVLLAILGITVFRYTGFGALLKKNFILWKRQFFAVFFSQIFALLLVGILAGVLLGFTSMTTTYYTVEWLGLTLKFTTPDTNRKMIYQNLRPFGGLFFLITFTYPLANMTVSLVSEKQTRMKEALRISGMQDWVHISTWVTTFMLKYLILVIGAALLTKYGAVFPNNGIGELSILFLTFVFSMCGLAFLIAVFFNKTRPAAIACVCVAYVLYFASFYFIRTKDLNEQANGCFIAPVCLALAVNTMFEDASLGSGFARAAAIYSEDPLGDMIDITTASKRLVVAGVVYISVAWYLEKVIPQDYGVRLRPDFVLQPLYPWARRAWRALVRCAQCRYCTWPRARTSKENSALIKEPYTARLSDATSPTDTEASCDSDSISSTSSSSIPELNMRNSVSIQHLCKDFRMNGFLSKRRAVNDLSLSFEKDQVTALLGANGAGKSTLIQMLTGMLMPTSGDVFVFGTSIRKDMHRIRKKLGWCPQHDILFASLTVKQHLELFSALRGKPLDLNATRRLLHDLKLSEKLHFQARTLSGGQRRKLCLAIALIGDTEVVFLDEMTAGVDPVSRRSCWEVIQKNRHGRAILLTTHFLDEADVLGDKIAIIANGALCCEGTSLDLKKRYGDGYRLTVGIPAETVRTPEEIAKVVQTSIPTSEYLSENMDASRSSEVTFGLPFSTVKLFPNLLRRLEGEMHCTVSISISTLEQVFLKVAAAHAEEDMSIERLRKVEPYRETEKRKFRAFWAILFIKRLRCAARDAKAFAMLIILPVLFCCALLLIPELRIYSLLSSSDGADAPMGTDACLAAIPSGAYGWVDTNTNPVEYTDSNEAVDMVNRTCCPQINTTTASTTLTSQWEACIDELPQCVEVQDAQREQLNCYVHTYSYCYALPWLCDASECCNPRNHKSPFYLCQSATPLDPIYLFSNTGKLNYNEYCNYRSLGVIQEYVNAFVRTLVLFLGFLFPPGSVIAFAVLETEADRQTKFQQLVNGVYRSTYWGAHYVFDQFSTVLPVVSLPSVLMYASLSSLTYATTVIQQATVLTLAFVFVCVPLAYAMSFSFRNHADALVVMVLFQIITGGALSVLVYVLKVVHLDIGSISSVTLADDYLRYCFSFFPGYAFADGLLRLQTEVVTDCASNNPWTTFGLCTNLFPEPVSDASQTAVTLALANVTNMTSIEGRYEPSFDNTLISVGYLLGVGVVCWLYVTFRELPSSVSCLRSDAIAKKHLKNVNAAAAALVAGEPPVSTEVIVNNSSLTANAAPAQTVAALGSSPKHSVGTGGTEIMPATFSKEFDEIEVEVRDSSASLKDDEMSHPKPENHVPSRMEVLENRLMVQGSLDVQAEHARVNSTKDDAVQILGLTKRYDQKVAVDDLWLGIRRGEVFGYLGVNGAGKSTTIRILTGGESATAGTATILGSSVRTQLTKARRSLGYCPQHDALYDLLTVQEHLTMYAQIRGLSDVHKAVRTSIERMQLMKFKNVIAKHLSGGNKRKLSAAIAMLGSPEVIILDEPTSGVDALSQRFMWDVIRDTTRQTQSAVMLVSHSMPEVETLSTRIGILIGGRLRAIGTATHLKKLYGSAVSLEVTLANPRVDESARLPTPPCVADGYVNQTDLYEVCEFLGNALRFQALQPKGEAASSTVGFMLNLPSIARVSWLEFQRWWLQEDAVTRLQQHLAKAWGGEEVVALEDRHESYLQFSIVNATASVADMFEFLETNHASLLIRSYALCTTGLENVFQTVVEQTDAFFDADESSLAE